MESVKTIEEFFKNNTFELGTKEGASAFTYNVSSFETQAISVDTSNIEYGDMFEKNETKIEFDKNVSEIDKWDYIASAASGTLTGVLSVIFDKKLDLKNAHEWGSEKINKLITRVARADGYTGDRPIAHLEKKHKMASDRKTKEFGGPRTHHLNDFSHHCSGIGLASSILTQFTGYCIGADETGSICVERLLDKSEIGNDIFEKLFNGTYGWVMHLLSDAGGSSQAINGGTGIAGPLLSQLKLLSTSPIFKNLKTGENDFATKLKRAFWGKEISGKNKQTVKFDLRTELGIAKHILKNSWTVLINELLVRIFYSIRRLVLEYQEKGSLKDIEWRRVLPFNNRTLTRMITISSGVFVAITTTGAAIKAAKQSGGNGYAFLAAFVLNLNFAGIGRFALAFIFDARYLYDDAKTGIEAFIESYGIKEPRPVAKIDELCLSNNQFIILYSLKRQKVLFDIEKSKRKKEEKKKWLDLWENQITDSSKWSFIESENELYSNIRNEVEAKGTNWLYLVAIELLFFTPYYKLNEDEENEFKGLKVKSEYENEIFVNNQFVVEKDFLEKVLKDYKKFVCIVDEQLKKKIIALGITSAILLPGDITGLALIGATPFVAMGSGIKSATELALGGGALFGIAGAGVPVFSSRGMVLNECAKILVYASNALNDKKLTIPKIIEELNKTKLQSQASLERLNEQRVKTSNQKQEINELKKTVSYIEKTISELDKLVV